jgi:bacteriocin-like protein
MDGKSIIRELTESELATVSGGSSSVLDFGIVRIYLQFPGGTPDAGPASGAMLCGANGCVTRIFGP